MNWIKAEQIKLLPQWHSSAMQIKRVVEYGQPLNPGIYWVILELEEKDVAKWDGQVWRFTERAADQLWGAEFDVPILAWVDEQNTTIGKSARTS